MADMYDRYDKFGGTENYYDNDSDLDVDVSSFEESASSDADSESDMIDDTDEYIENVLATIMFIFCILS